jgi:hypothetical protein
VLWVEPWDGTNRGRTQPRITTRPMAPTPARYRSIVPAGVVHRLSRSSIRSILPTMPADADTRASTNCSDVETVGPTKTQAVHKKANFVSPFSTQSDLTIT